MFSDLRGVSISKITMNCFREPFLPAGVLLSAAREQRTTKNFLASHFLFFFLGSWSIFWLGYLLVSVVFFLFLLSLSPAFLPLRLVTCRFGLMWLSVTIKAKRITFLQL